MGLDRPSAIQAATLTTALQDRNRPSGKQERQNVCLLHGMLVAIDLTQACPQAMCVVPTRELAIQIVEYR
jgi:superfamily II DNA/RNA helicase